ncbi:MAG: hypothetical protein ABEJ83_04235 [Candidatus Nanohaloarchaea archaeon]
MELFEVDCGELDSFLDKRRIVFWNLLVTEGRKASEKVDEGLEEEFKQDIEVVMDAHESGSPELEFSEEHDWHFVRNEGTLDTLLEIVLPRECERDSDMLFLTSVIMSTLAESQIFADGNKRTAYLAGVDFLSSVQEDRGMTHLVIPALDEELVRLLQEVAEGRSSQESLYGFLNGLREDIREYADN